MTDNIIRIAPDPCPLDEAKSNILSRRLNLLIVLGYKIEPQIDSSIIILKFNRSLKEACSPVMLLGNGDLATFEGWPYELDRIFIPAGDETKFNRFATGITAVKPSWKQRIEKYLKEAGELALYVVVATIIGTTVVRWLF